MTIKYDDLKVVAKALINDRLAKEKAPITVAAFNIEQIAAFAKCEKEVAKIVLDAFKSVTKDNDTIDDDYRKKLRKALENQLKEPEPDSLGDDIESRKSVNGSSQESKEEKKGVNGVFAKRVRARLIREIQLLGLRLDNRVVDSKVRRAGYILGTKALPNDTSDSIGKWARKEAERMDNKTIVWEFLTNRGYTDIQQGYREDAMESNIENGHIGFADFDALFQAINAEDESDVDVDTVLSTICDDLGIVARDAKKKAEPLKATDILG